MKNPLNPSEAVSGADCGKPGRDGYHYGTGQGETGKGAGAVAEDCVRRLICFFGTAFTIMAFHNDIGINKVFMKVYEMIAGEASDGFTILEVAYSIGLAIGIIVFFNHIGGRRITKDPTPIEVEMRIYEDDVNNALVETADREGKTIDVS